MVLEFWTTLRMFTYIFKLIQNYNFAKNLNIGYTNFPLETFYAKIHTAESVLHTMRRFHFFSR